MAANGLKTWFRSIIYYIQNQPKILLYVAILLILSFSPYINTLLLNSILENIEERTLRFMAASMLGYVVFQILWNLIKILSGQLLLSTGAGIDNILKKAVLQSAGRAEAVCYEDEKWLKEYKRAERITGCVHDVFVSTGDLLSQFVMLATYLFYLFRLISWHAFVGALILVPSLLQSFIFSRQNYLHNRDVEMDRQRADDIRDMFSKPNIIREIKLYNAASKLVEKWKGKMDGIFLKKMRLEIRFSACTALMFIFTSGVVFAVLFLVYLEIQDGRGSVGTLISLIPFMIMLAQCFKKTSNHVDGIYYSVLEYRDVCMFLAGNDSERRANAQAWKEPVSIKVENVSFRYPESRQSVLKGIHFFIQPGEAVALVGKNGSGKSTLLKILAGIYAPQEGCVRYNDIEIGQFDIGQVKSRIAFSFQEPIHYPFDLKRNILFGSEGKEADLEALLEQVAYNGPAASEDDILISGFKNSVNISGGQWQKICLARALKNRDASIFLFDEPTSALDPQAELDIFNTFLALARGKSVVVSTHRLGLARQADKIIVLEQGEVVGTGTHEQLLQVCEVYRNLYEAQKHWYA